MKKDVFTLTLLYVPLLGWDGGSSCVLWEIGFTQDLAVPPTRYLEKKYLP